MRIEVVAKNYKKASDFLRNEVGITGRALYHKIGVTEVLKGELRNVYSVTVDDQNTVPNNVQYVA